MLYILRQRNFAFLWFGGFISLIGDWMVRVALPIYIFQVTGSTLATGLMFMAGAIPNILLGSIAGVFVDRWHRKRTMVITNLLLALSLIPVLLIRSVEWLWIVYIFAFVQSSIAQFFAPAAIAFLPSLVGEEHLITANSLNALSRNLARLIGPTLGGLAVAAMGLHSVVLLDAATFLAAGLMIGLIRDKSQPTHSAAPATSESPIGLRQTILHEWLVGLKLVGREHLVTILFVITAIMSFGEGFFPVLFAPFVIEVLQGNTLIYGWLMSAQAVGGLIGGLIMGGFGSHLSSSRVLGWNIICFGVIGLTLYNAPAAFSEPILVLPLVLMLGAGVTTVISRTMLNTLLQTSVADQYRGRIFGTYNTMSSLLSLAGMGIASALGDSFGIVPMLSIQGGAYTVAGVIALILLRNISARSAEVAPHQTKAAL